MASSRYKVGINTHLGLNSWPLVVIRWGVNTHLGLNSLPLITKYQPLNQKKSKENSKP